MSKEKNIILPSLQRSLTQLGDNIRMARLRRRFSTVMVAERAGIARNTLRAVEQGDASVSFGAYAKVLFCLGLDKDLCLLAHDDKLGRKLQDARLPTKARAPRRNQSDAPTRKNKKKKHD